MAVLVGKKAPQFNAQAVVNGGEFVQDYTLDQFIGKKHVILFFYPKDFTFVCPTELHAFQEKLEAFQSRNTEVVAISTDTEQSHFGWLQMEKNQGGIKGVTYPLVADTNKTISKNYDVLAGDYFYDENDMLQTTGEMIAYRGLFLIDKEGILETRDVNARFVNGKPDAIESIYIMKSAEAWERFMRFMERYGQNNGLVFTKAN